MMSFLSLFLLLCSSKLFCIAFSPSNGISVGPAAFSAATTGTYSPIVSGLHASTLKDAGDVLVSEEDDDDQPAVVVNGFAEAKVEDDAAPELTEEEKAEKERDVKHMQMAIQQANGRGGERGARSPFPKPIVGAVIATPDGRIIGKGRASYKKDAVRAAIADAGIAATPLREWCVTWPHDEQLRKDIAEATLCATLEPSAETQPHLVLFRQSDEAFFGRRRTRHEETHQNPISFVTHSLTVQHHGGPSALRRRVTMFSYQTRIHYHVWM